MGKLIKHYSIGRTRKELADYVLNCTESELYELCSVIAEQIKGITTWSCDECRNRFNPDCEFDCDESKCKKYFSEMNQPFFE